MSDLVVNTEGKISHDMANVSFSGQNAVCVVAATFARCIS